MYDEETCFYYLRTRYYDPYIGRFLNADGYVSTGTGLGGYNMFAYCNGNPVMFVDPTGQFLEELWKLGQNIVSEIGKAFSSLAPAFAGCGGVAVADGPSPLGDIAAAGGLVALTLGAIGVGIYNSFDTNSSSGYQSNSIAQITFNELSDIARKYEIGECVEAAQDMLESNGGKGQIIELYFPYARNGFVSCERYPNIAISSNYIHRGYLYGGIVRCNIYPEGLPLHKWIKCFYDWTDGLPIVTIF